MLSRTSHLAVAFGLTAGLLLSPRLSLAWGHQAHAAIDAAAIAALPEDGPVFLRRYSDYIAASATIPDSWRHDSEPFSRIEEDPNHGWFRERLAFLKPIPRSRYEFIIALYRENLRLKLRDPEAARWMNVRWTGTLPYAMMEQYGHLVSEMRQLRAAQAEKKVDEAQFLEQSCASTIVQLGHYVGDGSQPLHDSMNSDGWRGRDPKGYTRDSSIHSRFESKYVKAINLTQAEVGTHLDPVGHQQGDLFNEVLAFLDRAGGRMERVYQLDQGGAFADPDNQQARQLVYEQTAAGASMLRDAIYRAWLEAAREPTKLPDPLDPHTPGYDPDTGSAPAPVDH